jgi:hypothetical protein
LTPIKRAGSLDGSAIRDALAATKDFPGVTGAVTFNENRDAVKPIIMIKIRAWRQIHQSATYAGGRRCDAVRGCYVTTMRREGIQKNGFVLSYESRSSR